MKKILKTAALVLMVSATVVSCKKKIDTAAIETQATSILTDSPNASVEVDKNGVVHLSGYFASEDAEQKAKDALKAIPGVKSVMDMTIPAPEAPVEVNDPALAENLQKVKDALKDFPNVKAEVVEGTLTLTGEVTTEQAMKIKQSIDALKIGKYDNKLTVK